MDASHPVNTEDALTTALDNFGHRGPLRCSVLWIIVWRRRYRLHRVSSSNKPCAPARRLVEASRTDRRRMRITRIDVGMFDGTGRERKQCCR